MVNTSDFSAAATLVQKYPISNILLPIEYMSHHLNSMEQNYLASELGSIAMISGYCY